MRAGPIEVSHGWLFEEPKSCAVCDNLLHTLEIAGSTLVTLVSVTDSLEDSGLLSGATQS